MSPWIAEDDKARSVAFLRAEDGISVADKEPLDSCIIVSTSLLVEVVKGHPKKVRVIVCLQNDFVPEAIGIEDILPEYMYGKMLHGRLTSSQLTLVLKITETPLRGIQYRNMVLEGYILVIHLPSKIFNSFKHPAPFQSRKVSV